jgi:hypothetical protein
MAILPYESPALTAELPDRGGELQRGRDGGDAGRDVLILSEFGGKREA